MTVTVAAVTVTVVPSATDPAVANGGGQETVTQTRTRTGGAQGRAAGAARGAVVHDERAVMPLAATPLAVTCSAVTSLRRRRRCWVHPSCPATHRTRLPARHRSRLLQHPGRQASPTLPPQKLYLWRTLGATRVSTRYLARGRQLLRAPFLASSQRSTHQWQQRRRVQAARTTLGKRNARNAGTSRRRRLPGRGAMGSLSRARS